MQANSEYILPGQRTIRVGQTGMVRTRSMKERQFEQAIHAPEMALEAELCRRDFFYFIKTFWGEVCQDELIVNWHIPFLAGKLMDVARQVARKEPKKDLIINISVFW